MVELHFDTLVVQGAKPLNQLIQPLSSPITLATAFEHVDVHQPYSYSRDRNPNREELEEIISKLEKGKYGLCFSSGMSAIACVLNLLKTNEEMICMKNVYAGTYQYLTEIIHEKEIKIRFYDFVNDFKSIGSIVNDKTKLFWIESPTNPNLEIVDIKLISNFCKENNILLVVDNTFMTPCFQNPLLLGADIVMHSVTKFINGHSDVMLGAIVTNNENIYKKIQLSQIAVGCVPSPFECFLARRGIKTLHLRMERHNENALKIAQFLKTKNKIKKVIYPGLKDHPQHELVLKQQKGFGGGIISIEMENMEPFLKHLKLFRLAESLGGVTSTLKVPLLMNAIPIDSQNQNISISPNLIRISVGIENSKDLIDDLEYALNFV